MKKWIFLLVFISLGCQKQPHSKDPIYSVEDDRLSLQGKVDILKNSSSLNDDALLASIALLYAQNKNWSEAKASISKAIKLNPLDASYHLYLANYNAELKNNLRAYNEAKIAYELGAYDEKLESLIARMAVETADTLTGSTFVAKYYQSNKNNVEAQLLMARLYAMQHNYEESEQLIKRVLAKDSMNIIAWQVAYSTYLSIDSTALAIEFGNKLISHDSTNSLYYYQVGKLYALSNEPTIAVQYFATSYQFQSQVEILQLVLRNYKDLEMLDSVLYFSDSTFAGINYTNKKVLLARARAFDMRYKYDESYGVYSMLVKMDSTDSVVNAEQEIVQRKIAYLWRRKREQKQLADSLANAMPIINF